jgi:site-specific DNA-methyltransferase (adenine-specific)
MLLLNGDCIQEMKKLIDDGVQVDSVVTDPPYELGFMGKGWDSTGIAFQKETWELAFQLLKPGGHLLAFSGSRTYHRMAVAIEDAGFEIRDQIMWIYGSGFPKSMNIGKNIDKIHRGVRHGTKDSSSEMHGVKREKIEGNTRNDIDTFYRTTKTKEYDFATGDGRNWDGWGTHLKPAHEPIVMARKPISEKTVADNVLKHGTGGINIDECRVEYANENDRSGWHKTGGGGKGYQDTNTFKIRKITPEEIKERTKDGRFPANVIHDGSDVMKDIFPKTGTKGKAKYPDTNPDFRDQGKQSKENIGIDKLSFGQTRNVKRKAVNRQPRKDDKVWTNNNSGMKSLQYTIEYEDSGDASRYFYCAKASKSERDQGLDNLPIKKASSMPGRRNAHDMKDSKIDNDVTDRFVTERKNIHPTVKPIKLMKYLCRLVTPKGGTVLDPFMGSGSTGMAAKDESFDFIGIEKEKKYYEIASVRIKVTSPLEEFMK